MTAPGVSGVGDILESGLSGAGEGVVKIASGTAGWVKPSPAPTL
jgi:hypothetical protein